MQIIYPYTSDVIYRFVQCELKLLNPGVISLDASDCGVIIYLDGNACIVGLNSVYPIHTHLLPLLQPKPGMPFLRTPYKLDALLVQSRGIVLNQLYTIPAHS